MIPQDELAAIAAALATLDRFEPHEAQADAAQRSRWKLAARNPELEMEAIRALH